MNAERPALVDSHAHLDMPEFDADREDVVRRARDAGIGTVLCPAELASDTSLPTVLGLVTAHPSFLAAAGVHPHQSKAYAEGHALALRELGAAGRIAAVGEIGLDFHYEFSAPGEQRAAFRDQLRLAGEIGLPVIVHSRLAGSDVVAAVRETGFSRGGILHCFTEGWDTASAMIDLGFLISFSGILTFPKAGSLRDVARKVPADRLLVETDSPFLAPVPLRARKRNEPAFVVETARVLAELKGLRFEDLAAATTRNFFALFGEPRAI
ncbi:MAG TPA: TatD family hydrolase [Acidobacteriota bacterium]|nr:TatD family hydrolase [Acidobacteriota bacterium]